jgi:hypothetical protein
MFLLELLGGAIAFTFAVYALWMVGCFVVIACGGAVIGTHKSLELAWKYKRLAFLIFLTGMVFYFWPVIVLRIILTVAMGSFLIWVFYQGIKEKS